MNLIKTRNSKQLNRSSNASNTIDSTSTMNTSLNHTIRATYLLHDSNGKVKSVKRLDIPNLNKQGKETMKTKATHQKLETHDEVLETLSSDEFVVFHALPVRSKQLNKQKLKTLSNIQYYFSPKWNISKFMAFLP